MLVNPFQNQINPWPAIRRERIRTLLPTAMQLARVDAWVVICRENANDPLAMHIGGENAGGTAAFIFTLQDGAVVSTALSPWGEAVGLSEMQVHDRVVPLEDPSSIWTELAQVLTALNPAAIAVNSSAKNIADGLSHTLRMQMETALPADLRGRLVSSENLVAEWLSVKLPQEVEIMRQAGALTVQIELEAYSRIVPGETRDSDVSDYIQDKVRELGLGFGWSPAHNPSVNSGFPRGHAGASDKVIIPGDFIQTDFGIKVFDVWCTDYQRFGYVLAPGEAAPPDEALHKFEVARRGHRIALAAMKPGVTGLDVDTAQRRWMVQNGSMPVRWGTGHPVGYWAHDIGPALTGGQREVPPPDSLRVLRPGQTFAFDGFFAWEDARPYGTAERLISVEEMAVVTERGAEYLIPPQEGLVLVRSK